MEFRGSGFDVVIAIAKEAEKRTDVLVRRGLDDFVDICHLG